ncbi:collagen-like triple helix repeat-containing protein, partial [Bacillus sp. AFS051223]
MIYIQDKNEKRKKGLLSIALEIILPYRLTGPTGPTGITGPAGITGPT